MYWIFRFFGIIYYKLFYRVKVFQKENLIKKGKCIVVSNHLGKSDVMVVGALFPNKTHFLSKIEWTKNKFLKWAMGKLGAIPIDREKPSLTSIKTALQVLKDDKRLCIFPEGTRNKVGTEIQEIKQGAAMFAVKGQAVITPIIIYEKAKIFRKNYVIVGKPIDLSPYYNVKFNDEISLKCSKLIYDKMNELQKELFKKVKNLKKKA